MAHQRGSLPSSDRAAFDLAAIKNIGEVQKRADFCARLLRGERIRHLLNNLALQAQLRLIVQCFVKDGNLSRRHERLLVPGLTGARPGANYVSYNIELGLQL